MSIEWEINLGFDRLRDEMEAKIPRALVKGLQHVRTVIDPDIPFDVGHLQASADITANGHDAQIYYPGPYALYQHEGVYYRHGVVGPPLKYQNGRHPFYLVRPMVAEAPIVIEIVGKELGF